MDSSENSEILSKPSSLKQNSSFLTNTSSLSSEVPSFSCFMNPLEEFLPSLKDFTLKKRSFEKFLNKSNKENLMKVKKTVNKKKRKESSLKQICTSILSKFISSNKSEIKLNDFASELKVERRRIYDIVNVLEGFDVVSKQGKNRYLYRGLEGFKDCLVLLENTLPENIPDLKVFSFEFKDPNLKKKSLTFLSIKLLKLFIIYKENINFKELIKLFGEKYLELKLNSNDKDLKKSENKNKIRRLYDIVNVFKSLGLIEKVINSSGKSVFRFKGVQGLNNNVSKLNIKPPSSPDYMRVTILNELMSVKSRSTSGVKRVKQDSQKMPVNYQNQFLNKFRSTNVKIESQKITNKPSNWKSNFEKVFLLKDNKKIRVLDSKVVSKDSLKIKLFQKSKNCQSLPDKGPFGLNHLSQSLKKTLENSIPEANLKPEWLPLPLQSINNENLNDFEKRQLLLFKKRIFNFQTSKVKSSLKKLEKWGFNSEFESLFQTIYVLLDNFHLLL